MLAMMQLGAFQVAMGQVWQITLETNWPDM